MVGRTFAEKVLARTSGSEEVRAGEVVESEPDLVMSHENTFLVNKAFAEFGLKKPWNPDKMVIVLDHRSPANTAQTAAAHAKIREIVREFGVHKFFDVGEGICHQILVEKKLARPGQLILGTDSHTTTVGAVGAFGVGIGATEMAGVWAAGKLWLKVPETTVVELAGHLSRGVYSKDVALYLASRLGPSGADYKCVEFRGALLIDLPVAGRMVLCNMAAEMGAKAAVVPADATSKIWFPECISPRGDMCASDPDARISAKLEIDVSSIEPMVSGPHKVEDVRTLDRLAGTRVDQAFIGTCTNGRLEDLIAAAAVLKGRRVASSCRLIVVPASREVLEHALDLGVIQTIVTAGGTILPPGCGPCLGAHEGVLGPDETCISSSNRNFRGRMGSEDAVIYLGSPATVAASAVEGEIADPRRYLT